jgi:hypothetical protein
VIVEDFVMLGTTVPEPMSDGRVSVCSAGWSPELGQLMRIYPLARRQVPSRWSSYRVRLERNPSDNRRESWAIAADRSVGAHPDINLAFESVRQVPVSERFGMLDSVTVGSIAEANERRLSLCVVHPSEMPHLTFDHNPDSPDAPQLRLFDVPGQPPSGSKRFPFTPRLEFADAEGFHRLQLRDWGSFEFLRKLGDYERRDELWGALHVKPNSSLLVGNMSHRRNNWLVISVLNGIRQVQEPLFALSSTGSPEATS